ncbi:unnamed protein product [Boreogadus saida]
MLASEIRCVGDGVSVVGARPRLLSMRGPGSFQTGRHSLSMGFDVCSCFVHAGSRFRGQGGVGRVGTTLIQVRPRGSELSSAIIPPLPALPRSPTTITNIPSRVVPSMSPSFPVS